MLGTATNKVSKSFLSVFSSFCSNISILEAIGKVEKILNKKAIYEYNETNRIGDHIWYISNVSKFKSHYPEWSFKYNIDAILEEICKYGHFG